MMRKLLMGCLLLLSACAESARLTVAQGTGPNPTLPQPASTLIPTVNIAPAKGWPAGVAPVPAAGLRVSAFASGLDHPRWLLVWTRWWWRSSHARFLPPRRLRNRLRP